MTNNPEIRINFSWLFYDDISKKLNKSNEWDLPSGEQCEEWAESYRQAWAKKQNVILSAMHDITGLKFYKSIIDITVAPDVIPKSEPLLISFMDTPETVIETITHELVHTLLCDNDILSIYGKNRDFKLGSVWQKQFGFEDDFNALVHVPVHAICKIIFEDHLDNKEYVKRDRKLMEKFKATSYLKSWDYVEKVSSEVIIEKLIASYAEIAKELGSKK